MKVRPKPEYAGFHHPTLGVLDPEKVYEVESLRVSMFEPVTDAPAKPPKAERKASPVAEEA